LDLQGFEILRDNYSEFRRSPVAVDILPYIRSIEYAPEPIYYNAESK